MASNMDGVWIQIDADTVVRADQVSSVSRTETGCVVRMMHGDGTYTVTTPYVDVLSMMGLGGGGA